MAPVRHRTSGVNDTRPEKTKKIDRVLNYEFFHPGGALQSCQPITTRRLCNPRPHSAFAKPDGRNEWMDLWEVDGWTHMINTLENVDRW